MLAGANQADHHRQRMNHFHKLALARFADKDLRGANLAMGDAEVEAMISE